MIPKIAIQATGPLFEGKAREVIHDQLQAAAHEIVMILVKAVKAGTPVGVFGDQGGLRAGIYGEVQRGESVVRGVVGHQSLYGDVVELGRRPGKAMPPKGSLVRWIEIKWGVDRKFAERMEYVVRRSIAGDPAAPRRREGAKMFQKAFERNYDRCVEIAQRYGLTIAEQLNG